MCRKTWSRVLLASCLAAVVAGCTPPEPPRTPGPFEPIAEASDLVIVGKAVRNEARWVGRHIVTTSRIEVLETLKGDPAGDTVEVSFLGGTVGVINEHVNHEPTLAEGEISVLFLKQAKEIVGQPLEDLRILGERGRVELVLPGERESRLQNNRRIRQRIDDIAAQVQAAGGA